MDKPLGWFKSSYSSANGQCVECRWLPGGGVAVRDSKRPDGVVLRVSDEHWQAFTARVKRSAG